ncbi:MULTISPECIES: nucleoside hydrolase [Aerococcus]|uniref:nucleoside hydrolase n=1 Tax=Aerococcus TaxID=1375 RepID=UPI000DCBF4CF|nr:MULTISPECIES: nucleoside hydrolase [Aerococcus]KAA9296320.1 nucleoside hydrolase [Aerococcus tenax]MDK6688913.1 nucleoside hydrolase [Aerococcus urinae]MDK8133788.1 nucleoside hydrolase [Aerococcus urinae]MDK8485530.1 nucleoside hydrolase [Aerococcus urinae]MDL5179059.1 nucleoside hydrolase [Aerococcus tenax]
MRQVIIDTDPGTDDSLAILLALSQPDIEVLGLTTVQGNQPLDQINANATSLVNYLGLTTPVYPGSDYRSRNPVIKASQRQAYHGGRGMGSLELPPREELLAEESAVDFIIRAVKTNPKKVNILTLGPLTNLARCLEKEPDLVNDLGQVYSMGGGIHKGKLTPVTEFNYGYDAQAAQSVYQQIGTQTPITMCGLDATYQAVYTPEIVQAIEDHFSKLSELFHALFDGQIKTYQERESLPGCIIHDVMAFMVYYDPDFVEAAPLTAMTIVTDSNLAQGLCVADLEGRFDQVANAQVVMKINPDRYFDRLMEAFMHLETHLP